MLMDWQDYTVWGIVACTAILIVRRARNLFRKDKRGGCSCCSGNCSCPKDRKPPHCGI